MHDENSWIILILTDLLSLIQIQLQMTDLYPIVIAVIGVLFIATLWALKNSLKIASKKQRKQTSNSDAVLLNKKIKESSQQNQQSQLCKIFKYYLKNYSILLLCKKDTSSKILCILFSYSLISFYLLYSTFWYPALSIGAIMTTISIVGLINSEKGIYQSKQTQFADVIIKKWKNKKIAYIFMAIVSSGLYLSLIGICYHYYINSQLKDMMLNTLLVFSLDTLGTKPFTLFILALITRKNKEILMLNDLDQKYQSISSKIGNEFHQKQIQSKHHFVINLQIEPQPIDLRKSYRSQSNKCNRKIASHHLPSSSIIDNFESNNEGSVQNMLSRVDSNKSGIHKMTSMKQLNEIELQKIEENPDGQLKNYFCLNVRKSKNEEESKQLQSKIEQIQSYNKQNMQSVSITQDFILQDFICKSPQKDDSQLVRDQQQVKARFSKSKGSIKGMKTFRILQKHEDYIEEKQNTLQLTRHEISDAETGYHKQQSFSSQGKRLQHRTSILKISDINREVGQLEQIDINSPNKRIAHKQYFDTHAIPEQHQKSKGKRNRRRNTKCQISQPYFQQGKLIDIYFPGKNNKSEIESFVRSRKKNFDRSQFFNHSHKKEQSKGRQKPIVHQNDQNHTTFFVPDF